jgi:hypothetical protein
MRHLLAAATVVLSAGPAIADDPACRAAAGFLGSVRDMLHSVELVSTGLEEADAVARDAVDLMEDGEFPLEKTTDEGWPEDYRETFGKLVALATDLVARGGELAEGEAATIRSYAVALKATTAERCDEVRIPVFIEPGGLACDWVVPYFEALAEHLPSLRRERDSIALGSINNAAHRAALTLGGPLSGGHWSTDTVAAMEHAAATINSLMNDTADPSADAVAEVVALSTTVAAEAQAICPTDTIPNLSAGT